MIPTAPLRERNRLAATILEALHSEGARRRLEVLAATTPDADDGLGPAERAQAEVLRRRARAASHALQSRPLRGPTAPLRQALSDAAALYDAGLGFEVHELLEPYWARARGADRDAVQGLIQIAVGYQHLANGNAAGARALVEEGATRLRGRSLGGLVLDEFGRTALAAIAAPFGTAVSPPFPRPQPAR